jgi:signal transduction histidine kinase
MRDIQIMTGMVDSAMAFVQGLERREPLEPVDLASVLETLCDEYRDLEFPVSYDGPAACRYTCRPQQLGRALRNVIDNAVKYGDCARVTLAATNFGVRITVADDGPGIPESEHERVFEPFYRLDTARNLGTGGSGLGLAILRTAVIVHGGEVSLANRAGGGLVVTIDLPEPGSPGSGPSGRDQA